MIHTLQKQIFFWGTYHSLGEKNLCIIDIHNLIFEVIKTAVNLIFFQWSTAQFCTIFTKLGINFCQQPARASTTLSSSPVNINRNSLCEFLSLELSLVYELNMVQTKLSSFTHLLGSGPRNDIRHTHSIKDHSKAMCVSQMVFQLIVTFTKDAYVLWNS